MKTAAEYAIEATAAYYAKAAALRIVLGILSAVVGVLGTLYVAYQVVTGVIHLVTEAWKLGGEELKKYTDLATNAATVSTDFYQRITKAAAGAKTPVDELTESFKKLNEATTNKLGSGETPNGSDASNRLNVLQEAGNLKGNTGVAALANANGTEEKYRATVDLINQAMRAGERLVALDIAKTLLGDKAAENLAKDAGYLDKMLKSADAIDSKDLISTQAVDNAVLLAAKYDDAVKILEQRWHPIQDLLVKAGVAMREVWVEIVSQIASAVDQVGKLIEKLGQVPSWFQMRLDSIGTAFMEATTTPESRAAAEKSLGIDSSPTTISELDQNNKLDAARNSPSTMADARRRLAEAMNTKFDRSKPTNANDNKGPETGAYDRATESLRKYTETTVAASQAVDLGAQAQERFKAIAQLTAAGMSDGLTREAARAKAEMSGLADKAGDAALALAKARVASEIKFDRQTAMLSAERVAIASQLRKIYPDVTEAINSSEAAQIRFNNTLRDLNNTGRDLTKGFASDFVSAIRSGASAWDSFAAAGANALNKIADKLMNMAIDNLWAKAFGGSTGGGLMSLLGVGGSTPNYGQTSNINVGGYSMPQFANGTNDAPGGWSTVGEKGPERMYVPKGSTIVPNGQRDPSDGSSVSAPVSIHIDATGADAAGLARVEAQLANLKATLPNTIVTTVQKARTGRSL